MALLSFWSQNQVIVSFHKIGQIGHHEIDVIVPPVSVWMHLHRFRHRCRQSAGEAAVGCACCMSCQYRVICVALARDGTRSHETVQNPEGAETHGMHNICGHHVLVPHVACNVAPCLVMGGPRPPRNNYRSSLIPRPLLNLPRN